MYKDIIIINKMNYKIKISCTSKDELCYNGKKITKYINLKQLINEINETDYIEKLILLHKNKHGLTIKSLEFLCNREISHFEFQIFIKKMKNIGFNSKLDTLIQLIKQNEIIYNYKFETITKKPISERKHKPNTSTYSTHTIYKK